MLRQVVILVGGKGTRLGRLTARMPKPLLEVGGRPFLDYLIWHFSRHGLTDILLLAGHYGEKIEAHYRDNPIQGADISVLVEPEPMGTAGALKFARDRLCETFILANGDSYFDFNVLALLDGTRDRNWLGKLALRRVDDAGRFGSVQLSDDGRITSFQEKRGSVGDAALINGGIYLLRREIISLVEKMPCSLETDVFPRLAAEGKLLGQEFSGYFIDIGIPESFQRAQEEVPDRMRRPAVFFDRDGTLNRDEGYTHKPEDLEWLPGAPEAIRYCNDRGYYVFVVTNQSGVARGYYDESAIHCFHAEMQRQLQTHGAHIDDFAYCPHHPEGVLASYAHACNCRKPQPGMMKELVNKWPVALEQSLLVGDKETDMECARKFGVRGFLWTSGNLLEKIEGILK